MSSDHIIAATIAAANGTPASPPETEAKPSETSLLSKIRRTNTQTLQGANMSGALLRRSKDTEWISTREDRQIPVHLVQEGYELHVVSEKVAAALGPPRAKDGVLHEACSLAGATFIIPCKVDKGDAAVTLAQAIEHSRGAWVQIVWNKDAGQYMHEVAQYEVKDGVVKEPVWDVRPFEEVLEHSLKGKVIDSVDHPVIQRILRAKT